MTYALVNQDAHDWLKTLPDSSVRMVCADPPYLMTSLLYEQPLDWPLIWRELYRVCVPAAQIVLFGAQPFATQLINSNPRDFRLERIWVKSRKTGHLNSKWRPLQQHENILVFCREPMAATYNPQRRPHDGKLNGTVKRNPGTHPPHYARQSDDFTAWTDDGTRQPTTVMEYGSPIRNAETHPSAKPEPLVSELVSTYSRPGDTVLDFCAGGGTTGAVCAQLGRRFLGAEIDPVYFAAAERRIRAAYARAPLVFDAPKEAPDHA